jgi:hypothetical protein
LKEKWPDFKSVVSFNRKEGDDFLWIPVIKIEEAKKEDCLLLIRAEPEERISFFSKIVDFFFNQ